MKEYVKMSEQNFCSSGEEISEEESVPAYGTLILLFMVVILKVAK